MKRFLWFAAVTCGLFTGTKVSAWSYHYNTQLTTWDAARTWCQTHFIDMVAIQNKVENDYLNEIIPFNQAYYWIGIRKINGIWTRVMTNKAITKEENWATGEPNSVGKFPEDCVEIYIKRDKDSGKWNNEQCGTKKKIALCYQASCNTTSCSQHGDCEEAIGNYNCTCHAGFFGPDCEHAITCEPLQSPSRGWMNCTHEFGVSRYNSSCNFTCKDGFLLNGSRSMFCNSSGDWTQAVPTCTAITCEPLQSPSHGWMNCTHEFGVFRYNSSCIFFCTDGFRLNGSKTMFCNSSSDWTQAVPTCTAITCEPLQSPSHGWMNCAHEFGDFRYNSSCNFSCTDGFRLNGTKSMFCNSSGDWTQAVPTCTAITCDPLQSPSHGWTNCTHEFGVFRYNSSCNFSCTDGFQLNGSRSMFCNSSGDWTQAVPTCTAITCEPLQSPSHGWMNCAHEFGDFRYNSSCNFSCTDGFRLNGSKSMFCNSSGDWTQAVPTCTAITCEPLQSPSHGWMNCAHDFGVFRYNSSCSFSCTDGFLLNGSKSMFCNSSGAWTQAVPTCTAITCEPLQSPSHGWRNCTHEFGDFRYNSSCDFSCTDGFLLNGSRSMFCNSSGDWTQAVPTCTAITCESLQSPSRGWMNCTHEFGDFRYNSTCDFSCTDGFLLNGSRSMFCNSSGDWTEAVPTCTAITCDPIQSPSHGWMNCAHEFGVFRYNSSCSFSCTDGFLLNGTKSMFCNSSGDWTQAVPTCTAITCEPLQSPSHGWRNCTHEFGVFRYNSTCDFSCKDGFLLNGSRSMFCNSSSDWTQEVPTCTAITCESLQSPSHGWRNCTHEFGDFRYNSTCDFSCTDGFLLNGSRSMFCNSSGDWTQAVPTCTAITCEPIQSPSHGWMNCAHEFGVFRYNSSCSFSCTDGFLLNGTKSIFCNSSGDWTQAVPTCTAITCEPLQSPSHGWRNCTHEFGVFRYNSTCDFSCKDGFLLNGSRSMFCNSSSDWTQAVPTCTVVVCNGLSSSSPRAMNCFHPNGNFSYGSECNFDCADGFALNGTTKLSCLSSGYWSDSLPNCEGQSFSFGRQILLYTASSALAAGGVALGSGLIIFIVKRLRKK
ncbi:E-selectin isoform X2 [Xenopus laevis]|nr:E-selectin isoform X2 [Xenopus laevis]